MGDFLMFLIVLIVMVVGMVLSLPKSRRRAQAILEQKRPLTDNDPRLIEAIGIRDAAIYGILWGAVPAGLLSLRAMLFFSKTSEGVMMFFVFMAPPAILLFAGAWAFISIVYKDALRLEVLRQQGAHANVSNNAQKTHTVRNAQSEIIQKLEKANQHGPLVLLHQQDTDVSRQAEEKRRANAPWTLSGWRASDGDLAFVLGKQAFGKTNFLLAQLIDWMQSGRSFVSTDIKPEIWSLLKENGLFERFGYSDWVVNPTCPYAHRFNPFSAIKDDTVLDEALAVMIPRGEGDEALLMDSTRQLLKAVLVHLGEGASLPAARDYISAGGTMSELLEVLSASEKQGAQRIALELKNIASNKRLLALIRSEMNRIFEFMDNEGITAAIRVSDFSMHEVLMKPRQAVFLQFEQKHKALATLFGSTVAYVLRVLQSTAREREYPVFVALDEIMGAAPIPNFSEKLSTMRSAKMPIGIYLQSVQGFDRRYGAGTSDHLMEIADLGVFFRVGDNETAEYLSTELSHAKEQRFNQSEGTSSTGQAFNAAELLSLDFGKAIVLYQGHQARFSMPRHDTDYPIEKREAMDPCPQAGFTLRAETHAATG